MSVNLTASTMVHGFSDESGNVVSLAESSDTSVEVEALKTAKAEGAEVTKDAADDAQALPAKEESLQPPQVTQDLEEDNAAEEQASPLKSPTDTAPTVSFSKSQSMDAEDEEDAEKEDFENEDTGASSKRAPRGRGMPDKMSESSAALSMRDLFHPTELIFSKRGDDHHLEQEPIFGEDAYSLIGTSPIFSQSAAFAWFVIVLQGGMLLVTLLDLIDLDEEAYSINGVVNRMQIPAGASIYVTVSQFLGLLLTVLVMAAEGDLVLGASQLIKGYHKRLQEKNPNVTYGKWLFTGIFQAFMGSLLLLNSFILSMRSTTVIDLALNLTALHFLQEFDEKAFEIATETGLLGDVIKEECEKVQELVHYTTPKKRRRYIVWKRIIIGLMSIGLLAPYFVVLSWQNNGRFLCDTLYIQFGDAFFPEMAHYSGLFYHQGFKLGDRKDGRVYYVDSTETFKMGYCQSEQGWTISRLEDSTCEYLFKSPETDTYDVIQVANLDWVVSTRTSGDVMATWFKVKCNDCSEDTCNSEYGYCNEEGTECLCKEGRFGVNCEHKEHCMWFALDQTTRGGMASIPGTAPLLTQEYVSASFRSNLSFYDRPIYLPSKHDTAMAEVDVDSFIVFTGRRWIIYAIPDERRANLVNAYGKPTNWTNSNFYKDFERYTSKESHFEALEYLQSELINYFPVFFSTPMDYGEDSDAGDPRNVNWMSAKDVVSADAVVPRRPDEKKHLTASLLCSDCGPQSLTGCQNGGYCASNGECICRAFYAGFQCERVKDCVEAGGCNGAGTCNRVTRTCECEEGSFGTLCQLGVNKLEDEFLCTHCNLHGQGECLNGTFSQECTCQEGYYGVFCNETDPLP